MDTFKVCIFCRISRFNKSFKSSLHQCRYTAAENCLFTEEVCLCLDLECTCQKTCSCTSDCCTISKRQIQCSSGCILLYTYESRNALSVYICTSYCVARCFWSDHGYVHACRWFDLSKVDCESMSEHQHLTFCQIWLDVFFVHVGL